MSIQMQGLWKMATAGALEEVSRNTGVYEIRSCRDGAIITIDYAGVREPFGLHSALTAEIGSQGDSLFEFRYEQHVLYMTRFVELVLEYRAQHDGFGPERVMLRHPEIAGRISPFIER